MRLIGLDIGTTTICAVLYSVDKKCVERIERTSNDFIIGSKKEDAIEDPECIYGKVKAIVEKFSSSFSDIVALSISAQMHGILYVDEEGNAVSPFYTWQNQRGLAKEKEISQRLGYTVHSGYGLVTHLVMTPPKMAVKFCSIGDYVVMRLVGLKSPVTDITLAASLGIFDLAACRVTDAYDTSFFPEVVASPKVIGTYRGMKVVTAIGDNQASFLGSVDNLVSTLLVNYGTAGQISYFSKEYRMVNGFEIRPMGGEGYLNVAFSLTGGDSYAILASFFKKVITSFGLTTPENMYSIMDVMEVPDDEIKLKCESTFLGRRDKSNSYASFSNITKANFTPEAMTAALIQGMAEELYQFYKVIPPEIRERFATIRGAGNGIRKNKRLKEAIKNLYGLSLAFSSFEEESCMGAVINAGVGALIWQDYSTAIAEIN